MIGLNDQIETNNTNGQGQGSNSGVGFATPSNSDVRLAKEIIATGHAHNAYVGVSLDPTVTGRLFVVGQSGTLYTVLFKVANPADDVVHLTTAPTTPVATPQPFAVASVLRALRTQTVLPGHLPGAGGPPCRRRACRGHSAAATNLSAVSHQDEADG